MQEVTIEENAVSVAPAENIEVSRNKHFRAYLVFKMYRHLNLFMQWNTNAVWCKTHGWVWKTCRTIVDKHGFWMCGLFNFILGNAPWVND